MRKKIPKLVISFDSTTDAMALEAACADEAYLGRIIPLPTQISASCGLAWCAKLEQVDALKEKMAINGITPKDFHIIEFYF